MKYAIWVLVVALLILRQDNWLWENDKLVFGFMPIGLFYHVCLSIAAAAVWWLVGRTLRPVEEIRGRVAEIGLGELGERVPEPGSGDEIDTEFHHIVPVSPDFECVRVIGNPLHLLTSKHQMIGAGPDQIDSLLRTRAQRRAGNDAI